MVISLPPVQSRGLSQLVNDELLSTYLVPGTVLCLTPMSSLMLQNNPVTVVLPRLHRERKLRLQEVTCLVTQCVDVRSKAQIRVHLT